MEVNLTTFDILLPVVGVLAFVGYVFCLLRMWWQTGLATAGVAVLLWFGATDAGTFWVYPAAFVVAGAVVAGVVAYRGRAASPPKTKAGKKQRQVVIDGTNVMFWDGDADLTTLRNVVVFLQKREIEPIVFLDASSRHHLKDTSLDERAFARALGLSRKQVNMCPAQTEADAFLLKFARQEGLAIVSNDRFGDRAKQARGIKKITGVIAGGRPILQGL